MRGTVIYPSEDSLVLSFCSKGWHVIMACRNEKKGKSALRDIMRSLKKSLNESMAAKAQIKLEIVDMVSFSP